MHRPDISTSSLSSLADEVRADIVKFIEMQEEILFNEFDLQMQLCLFLRQKGGYERVYAEYYMPTRSVSDDSKTAHDILRGYDWDSNMRVDIVVKRDGEYVPIELKYTTRQVVGPLDRFGQHFDNLEILRNQGAQDLVRYNCWKDVRRLELIKKIFGNVRNGFAVHLTCDESYTRPPRATSACYPFDTSGSRAIGAGVMDWLNYSEARKAYTPFSLDGSYQVKWQPRQIGGIQYYYEILTI